MVCQIQEAGSKRMSVFLPTQSVYYDQVNLIGQPQDSISSRDDIPKDLANIIVAPMAAVVGQKFALEALNQNLSVCLHRFGRQGSQKKILHKIYDEFGRDEVREGWKEVWVSVGLNDVEAVEDLDHTHVLIDVANGYLGDVTRFARALQSKGYVIMVGNVHTAKGLNRYRDCRVRVGIGNGSPCDTAIVTGYNRGQITELTECVRDRYNHDQKIVADGGIKSGGDAAKAFGLGADYVMTGGYFSLAEEAQNVIDGEYRYWGGASQTQQIKSHGKIKRHSEGKDISLSKKDIKPLEYLVKEFWGGISSAISYSGHANLTQFRGNGVFETK